MDSSSHCAESACHDATALATPIMIGLVSPAKGLNTFNHVGIEVVANIRNLRSSGRNQSVDNVFDVGLKFLAAQTGRLLLSLELQKSKVNRIDQPRLVPGLV